MIISKIIIFLGRSQLLSPFLGTEIQEYYMEGALEMDILLFPDQEKIIW